MDVEEDVVVIVGIYVMYSVLGHNVTDVTGVTDVTDGTIVENGIIITVGITVMEGTTGMIVTVK